MKTTSPLSKKAPEPISGAEPTPNASPLDIARPNSEITSTKPDPPSKRRRTFLEAAALWVIARR